MTILEEIVRTLSNPAVYPEITTRVETTQTQMSIVFLTDNYVYKIKKPVNLGYLDYTTLAQRRYFCEQEVTLNSRFGGDVYLGVIPITSEGKTITLNGTSEPIEYAVKMRRLPADRMMDVLLAQNRVTPEMILRVAEKIAAFHANAASSPDISKFGSLETITFNTEENFSQTEKYLDQVFPKTQFNAISRYTRNFIKNNAELLKRRVIEGKIKDCHGDLHAQHICFTTKGIAIYDCIEFNDRFRYVDVAAEVSFLAMDLDHWGNPDLSQYFVTAYVSQSRDKDVLKLQHFYKCYFAYVRAKVSCFKSEAPLVSPEDKAKALKEAQQYFNLAESYIE
ncbi:MAG: hypothetical protein PHE50_01960 [Dehalococcoidales bacterium]|nr:hypothetical protein [Dehalococcoidales bacterium]